MIGGTSTL
jgi:hypothetical protein